MGAVGWGNEGHTDINRVAAEKIPASMPRFMRRAAAVTEIAYLGPEPDRWRNPAEFALKNSQEPDHFLDMERVAWLDPLPKGRYEFLRKLYEKRASTTDHPDDYLPEHVGLQPYITMEVYGRLKARVPRVPATAGGASADPGGATSNHFLRSMAWATTWPTDRNRCTPRFNTTDGSGPNPNGYTTQHSIHSQFETAYVAANITDKDFSGLVKAPERIDDPFAGYVAYLRNSNSLVENVYSLEKAGGFTGKGSPAAFDFTTHRLAAGSQMLLDLWYTAWMESAVPAPEHPPAPPATK